MTLKSVQTLLDVLHFADSHTAMVVPELGINVTYDSLRQQVLAMANALASAGIRRGDAVAIALPNGLPAVVSFLAASIAGTAAPLNPAYPYEEFHFFLGDTNARILLCPPVGAEFVRTAAKDRNIPVRAAPSVCRCGTSIWRCLPQISRTPMRLPRRMFRSASCRCFTFTD